MLSLPQKGRNLVDLYDKHLAHLNLFPIDQWTNKFQNVRLQAVSFEIYLRRTSTLFITFFDSLYILPFPFPKFWKIYGTGFFFRGILSRFGRHKLWNRLFNLFIRYLYRNERGWINHGSATLLVARKEIR